MNLTLRLVLVAFLVCCSSLSAQSEQTTRQILEAQLNVTMPGKNYVEFVLKNSEGYCRPSYVVAIDGSKAMIDRQDLNSSTEGHLLVSDLLSHFSGPQVAVFKAQESNNWNSKFKPTHTYRFDALTFTAHGVFAGTTFALATKEGFLTIKDARLVVKETGIVSSGNEKPHAYVISQCSYAAGRISNYLEDIK